MGEAYFSIYFNEWEINDIWTGDILRLENRDKNNRRIMLFADSLLTRRFKGKFLVSRCELENEVYGITIGRTVA